MVSLDVVVKEFGKLDEFRFGDVVEPSREVIRIDHTHFPTRIPNINAPVNRYGDFLTFDFHPCPNGVAMVLKQFRSVVKHHGEITPVISWSSVFPVFLCPSGARCSASNRPSPSANSSCPLRTGAQDA